MVYVSQQIDKNGDYFEHHRSSIIILCATFRGYENLKDTDRNHQRFNRGKRPFIRTKIVKYSCHPLAVILGSEAERIIFGNL